MNTIGIMGAMPEEVELIVAALQDATTVQYAGVDYHIGCKGGRKLVVCHGGMGKVNAASTSQVLITHFGVDALIFTGIAGNMSTEIGIGDVVISREVLHHDAEDRMMSQSAPFTALYTAHPMLIEAAKAGCALTGVRHIVGRIATGEKFIGDSDTKADILARCKPDCVEMEGAAVGQVAVRNEIPFVVIRAMSDNSDASVEVLGAEEFEISEYVKTSSAIVLAAVDALQELLPIKA